MIRPATIADVPAMLALGQQMHDESRFDVLRWSARKVEALLHTCIASEDALALVAERDGAVIGGFIGFVGEHWCSEDRVAYDMALYIRSDRRGSIAGVRLLVAYREWAQSRGAVQITCGITTGVTLEATTRLYQAAGFVHVGHLFEYQGTDHVHRT